MIESNTSWYSIPLKFVNLSLVNQRVNVFIFGKICCANLNIQKPRRYLITLDVVLSNSQTFCPGLLLHYLNFYSVSFQPNTRNIFFVREFQLSIRIDSHFHCTFLTILMFWFDSAVLLFFLSRNQHLKETSRIAKNEKLVKIIKIASGLFDLSFICFEIFGISSVKNLENF